MSRNPDDIDDIRRKKKEKIREKLNQQEDENAPEDQESAEQQKDAILKKLLTEEARRRLNTVEMARPEFAEQVKNQIVALSQRGRIQDEIDGDTMKKLLNELGEDENDGYDIKGMGSRTS